MQQPKELNFLSSINGLCLAVTQQTRKHVDEPVPVADLLSFSPIKRHPSCVSGVAGQHDLGNDEKKLEKLVSDDNLKHATEASRVMTSYVQAYPNPGHPGQSHQYLEFHTSGHHDGSKGEGVRANRGDHDGGDVGMNHGRSCCHCVRCTSCWCRNDHA